MAIIKDYDLQVHFSIFQFIVLDSHQPHQPRFQPKITQTYPPGEHSGGFIIEKESNRAKKRANIGAGLQTNANVALCRLLCK